MKQMEMTRPIDTDPSIFGAAKLSSNCKASVTDLSKSVVSLAYISFSQSLLYLCIPIYYILEYISSMGAIKTILENHLPGVHVHSLMIGKSPNEDTLNGFFMSVNHQMEIACDLIKNDPLLQDG